MIRRSPIVALALTAVLAVGCGTGATNTPSPAASASGSPNSASPAARTALTVGLGYIPSIQFAHFYLAEENGYYDEAGLDVTFQNTIDPDLITLVGQGAVDIGNADGTSVIPAVSQGIPIRYVATLYGTFPSIVFAKASSGITTPADLEGKKLGTPGRYGSSWIMLQAMLESAGLTTDDLEIVEYPDFGQGSAVAAGAVDAATGFTNNEPVQLELAGEQVTVLHVDDSVPLQGPGLIVGVSTLDEKADAVRAFIAATLRAMDEIAANPDAGLDASIAVVPELGEDHDTQRAILEATIETWRGRLTDEQGFGALDPDGWQASLEYMTSLGLVPNPVTVDDLIVEGFLPER